AAALPGSACAWPHRRPHGPPDRATHERHRTGRVDPYRSCDPRARECALRRPRRYSEKIMSGGEQIAAPSRAMEIEAQAAMWLRRKAFWDWTAAEQAELDAWLGEASAHRVAFWRLNAALARTERLSALRSAEAEAQAKKQNRFLPFVLRAGAAF